jgi:hypothetical protein
MINIVAVEHGNYCGRGREYVSVLADMVKRSLHTPYRFICYTDDPEGLAPGIEARAIPDGLTGWWAKLFLFAPGQFPEGERVIYIDLDSVILGGMEEIAKYNGEFCILRDFYRPDGYGSGLMAWRSGFGAHIWQSYEAAGFPDIPGGDQAWIERHVQGADLWQDVFPGRVRSYKSECRNGVPDGTWIVCFHGQPRPHDCNDPFIDQIWKIGGDKLAEFNIHCNTVEQDVLDHARHAISLDIPWIAPDMAATLGRAPSEHMVVVGGGPSLADTYRNLRRRQKQGHHIWAVNAVHDYLIERHIVPDCCALLDARIHTVDFVRKPHPDVTYFVGSQVHPDVFKALEGYRVVLWHAAGVEKLLQEEVGESRMWVTVGGGSSVGVKSPILGNLLGYRKFALYGMDSSYRDGENHAYRQEVNDGERLVEVTVAGRKFLCARWMAAQGEDFKTLYRALEAKGCEVTAHGDGLIPHIYRRMVEALRNAA